MSWNFLSSNSSEPYSFHQSLRILFISCGYHLPWAVSENNIHQEIIPWAAIYPNNSSTSHILFADQVLLCCSSATVPGAAELTLSTEKGLKLILLVITTVAGADLTSSTVQSVVFAHSVEFVLAMGFYCFVGISDIWKWQSCVTTKQFGFITWMVIITAAYATRSCPSTSLTPWSDL